jgi:ParB/RepB/Spo0J family partition protein
MALTQTTEAEGTTGVRPVAALGTTLSRARCLRPAQIERMKHSLATHGQLTPVVAVLREAGRLQLVDGFKRRAAAAAMGWTELVATVRPLDEHGQWVAMLTLNRGPQTLTILEEALILREMLATGLTQVAVGQLLARHKSWVSRRVGLLERLHPELIDWIKEGLLAAGTAQRLLPLPPGNQLEFAAAVGQAGLGPLDTELLVSLWRKTTDPEVRSFLLREPRQAVVHARPHDPRLPPDPRLSPAGQRVHRWVRIMQGVGLRLTEELGTPLPLADAHLLAPDLQGLGQILRRLGPALGTSASSSGCASSDATSVIPTSAVSCATATATRPPHASPEST